MHLQLNDYLMMHSLISHSTLKLKHQIKVPSSKSQTMRALIFALLANGESNISQYLHSPDTNAMINAIRQLGARVCVNNNSINIIGVNGQIQTPSDTIDCGNSGQVLRFIAGLCALQNQPCILDGDHSIQTNRPMIDIITGINQLGGTAISLNNNHYAPLQIKGPIKAAQIDINGDHAQPVSALLIASSFLDGTTTINVKHPNETPWIELTLHWLCKLGIKIKHDEHQDYTVTGPNTFDGFNYSVPGDFSSAAFPAIAALIKNQTITIANLDSNDPQGDKQLFVELKKLGANINWQNNNLIIEASPNLKGGTINVNHFIDAVPILAVLGCALKDGLIITGAKAARKKESDRLLVMCSQLNILGADITETDDGLIVKHSNLHGGIVDSHHDHRVAMALYIAGLISDGPVTVRHTECIVKSYAGFLNIFTT